MLETRRPVVMAMVRAIARAEQLVHADLPAAEEAVARALPHLDRKHVHTLVTLYQPAIPETPRVRTEGLAPALALFPSSRKAPSLDGVPLADFVATGLLDEAQGSARPAWTMPLAATDPATSSRQVPPRHDRTTGALALAGAFVVAAGLALGRLRGRSKSA
jgi:hypothetical protein